ncbi:L-asparaginase II [Lipingzhangella halophila]|uniref:L-asparaginase II n=1 Tax=Lipingzhangella halophila TaxID=1783352 RepID=A0A7W7REN0_9ACTN|nr:asparaginase [Lipingzhangella halophila]MBB4930026.1 L-asparaginase II [Lipingzhangella halophila]
MRESPLPEYVSLVEVVRGGFREGVHYGAAVGLTASGEIGYSRGSVSTPMLPRSAAKPFQAAAALRAGAGLGDRELAVAAGSHSGQGIHVAAVEKMLADIGLSPDALGCPAAWPMDRRSYRALLRAGGSPSKLQMNCSGKHAAMLAACVGRGWSVADYLSPGHPLQVLVRETIEELCGEPVTHTVTDGCGAPQMAVSLSGLARGLRAMAHAVEGSPEAAVLRTMRDFPEYVAGEDRSDTRLMRGLPGLVAKIGAEGVLVLLAPAGETVAVKISDGDPQSRARTMAGLTGLRALGVDIAPVSGMLNVDVLGGGEPVGNVRPISST